MFKAKLIMFLVKFLMWGTVLGLGVWYLSSALGGAALTYTSVDNFLISAGVENGDIASANGCVMCGYIADLFGVLGDATQRFWTAMLDYIWVIMVVGFGIFLVIYSIQYLSEALKKSAETNDAERKLEFKGWFDKVWKQGLRVLIAGAFIGAIGMGGTDALKTITNITVTPVMYLGAEFSMAATGVTNASQCYALERSSNQSADLLDPILQPFMCVIGNINAVMLAGAAGGFAMMNYAWMGLGGGVITWIAGLGLVLMFLVIGFNLFFQILTVVFKLIFVIIFLPLIIAAATFEQTWKVANGLLSNSINMLVSSAVRVIAITLKVLIVFGTVSYAADMYFPGGYDGYSAILPPMMGRASINPDAQTLSVMNVFSTCEGVALVNGEMDKDLFKDCFTAQKAMVERTYPGAFDFLKDGWDFLLMMGCIFLLYYYVIDKKIDKMLSTDGKEDFDFGGEIKKLGKKMWSMPTNVLSKVLKK